MKKEKDTPTRESYCSAFTPLDRGGISSIKGGKVSPSNKRGPGGVFGTFDLIRYLFELLSRALDWLPGGLN
jgi:hypothetical protein